MTTQNINRYSETDLAEFKVAIDKKIEKAARQLNSLEEQLASATESKDNEGDWMDNSSSNSDIEMLEVMASRQKKHLLDLQNALQRIYNKSYGICIVTGELIDKRRMMAVLTTTKSLAAKVDVGKAPTRRVVRPKASKGPKIFSRIIPKPKSTPQPKVWEDEEDLDLELDDELGLGNTELDLDNYSEEDLD